MPARYRRVVAALKALGIEVWERPGKGSHVVLSDAQGRTYPLSLHRGDKTELSDVYLRGVCRAFGLDYAEFKKRL